MDKDKKDDVQIDDKKDATTEPDVKDTDDTKTATDDTDIQVVDPLKDGEVIKALKDIKDALQAQAQPTDKDTIKDALREILSELRGSPDSAPEPKAPFDVADATNKGEPVTAQVAQKILRTKAPNENVREVQKWADNIYILSQILGRPPQSLKAWEDEYMPRVKALSTGASGQGAEWIPTGWSNQLFEDLYLVLKVAALHGRFNMPQNPYTFPVALARSIAKLGVEAASDTPSKIPVVERGSDNLTFTAKKLVGRTPFSTEIEEDSIVPILPLVRDNLIYSLAAAEETAIINGDTAGTHMDSDVSASNDARKAWDGYRKLAQAGAKVDLGTFSVANIRKIRRGMGKYGLSPSDLAIVCSISTYMSLLDLDEVLTLDKYGPNATILNGELGKFDGSPIIVSEHVREDLNATGVYDGTTTTQTELIYVHRPSLLIGDRRRPTVKTKEDIETDQIIMVTTTREDFEPVVSDVTTNLIVGIGYNITA